MDKRSSSPPPNKKKRYEPSQLNAFPKPLKKINPRFISKSARFVKKYPMVSEDSVNKPPKIISFEDFVIYSPNTDISEEFAVQPSLAKDDSSKVSIVLSPKLGTSKDSSVSFKDSVEDFNLHYISDIQLENLTDLSEIQTIPSPKVGTSHNSNVSFDDSFENFNLHPNSEVQVKKQMNVLETQNTSPSKVGASTNSNILFGDSDEVFNLDPISNVHLDNLTDLLETRNSEQQVPISSEDSMNLNDAFSTNEIHGNRKRRSTFDLDLASIESLRSLVNGCPLSKALVTNSNKTFPHESSCVSEQAPVFNASGNISKEVEFDQVDQPHPLQNNSLLSNEENADFRGKLSFLKTVPNQNETKQSDAFYRTLPPTKSLSSQNYDTFLNTGGAALLEKSRSSERMSNDSEPPGLVSHTLETTNKIGVNEISKNPSEIAGTNILLAEKTLTTNCRRIVSGNDWFPELNGMGDQCSSKSQYSLNKDGLDAFGYFVTTQLRQLPLKSAIACQNDIVELFVNERMKVTKDQTLQEKR